MKKDNYIESKLYRLIILLNILRKALKIIIVKYLSDYIKSNNFYFKINKDKKKEIYKNNIRNNNRSNIYNLKL